MKIHGAGELIKDASEALQMLKEGNERYLKGAFIDKSVMKEDREILADGQKPFAVIVCCSDSRVAPELFFDQKLGDIFIIRNAGNVVDQTALGSIEYAVEHLGTPLVVVCGHSKCGAVTAACQGGDTPPNIQSIMDRIQPSVAKGGDVEEVVHHNIDYMVDQVKNDEIIQHLKTEVVGAYYDVHTGVVEWL